MFLARVSYSWKYDYFDGHCVQYVDIYIAEQQMFLQLWKCEYINLECNYSHAHNFPRELGQWENRTHVIFMCMYLRVYLN